MTTTHISKIQPGAILAAPVLDSYGNPLLDRGTVITDKHLHLMKTWGIQGMEIVSESIQEDVTSNDPDAEDDRLEIHRRELTPIFRKTNLEHPAMKEIFRLAVRARAKKSKGLQE